MFDLKRPCANCPFTRTNADLFQLPPSRLDEIVSATAFQCHKTVDYSGGDGRPGSKPQQCAGLMAVLHAVGRPNQIMQVAERLADFDPSSIKSDDCFSSLEELYEAHGAQEPPSGSGARRRSRPDPAYPER